MQSQFTFKRVSVRLFCGGLLATSLLITANAQSGRALYDKIKAFSLTGGKADVTALAFKRDRVEMLLTGTIYFAAPIDGRVTGAIFVGQGTFRAAVPASDFEKANVKRLLGTDDKIETEFTSAVFKFSDESYELLGKRKVDGPAPAQAQDMASEIDTRILKETGANISARVALSIVNKESPGFFFANFRGGKLGDFSYVYDHQNRIPTAAFGINAGERGIIFRYDTFSLGNDILMAFYALSDYERGTAPYSDQNDLVDITNYDMNIDLRQPRKALGLDAKATMQSKAADLRAIPFSVGESLSEYDNQRLKKQMRLKSVRMGSTPLETVQEDWEGGFTVFLPNSLAAGQSFELEFELAGDFLRQTDVCADCSYPISNQSWYPRHGYLDRSTFNFTFTHSRKLKVASVGSRMSETPDPADKDAVVTKYSMTYPVALVTFALGLFDRHTDTIKWDNGDKPTPLEFNSLSGGTVAIKEDFILAELNNSVRYFQNIFGKYPYDSFGAVFHPYGFGQGFATMLTIPNADRATKYTYLFISHETAHQWWGNIVAWRSYRDQWLSEGFAEYSGMLYAAEREKGKTMLEIVDDKRRSVKDPPMTPTGPGKGKLTDVGPLILGHRLETRKTRGAYTALVYDKGAMVLRMIHFLMTDPSNRDGKAFFDMMKDFVGRYKNKVASTDDFRMVANEHFAKTPIAQKYHLTDLNWFFRQWVYSTELPSYRLNYQIQDQPDGSVVVTGTVNQDNAGPDWFMPLPVVFKFGGDKYAYGTVAALGPSAPFTIKLPIKPESMALDPDRWVLSEKTSSSSK